jgi:hypothetical protein
LSAARAKFTRLTKNVDLDINEVVYEILGYFLMTHSKAFNSTSVSRTMLRTSDVCARFGYWFYFYGEAPTP